MFISLVGIVGTLPRWILCFYLSSSSNYWFVSLEMLFVFNKRKNKQISKFLDKYSSLLNIFCFPFWLNFCPQEKKSTVNSYFHAIVKCNLFFPQFVFLLHAYEKMSLSSSILKLILRGTLKTSLKLFWNIS